MKKMMQDPERIRDRVTFPQFVRIFEQTKMSEKEDERNSESEMLDAFVAVGGEENGDGAVDSNQLIEIIK